MKDVLVIKTETTHRDGKTHVREIKAVGFMDDAERFHIIRCFGRMYSVKDTVSQKNEKTVA